ncbi:MAG: cytochrome c3 family protein [Thermodesulfobacteriota bacterium]
MQKKSAIIMVVVAASMVFLAMGLYAACQEPDVIKMEDPSYKHTKGIVEFSHKKHSTDYKLGCGECHHDKDHKPLANLKAGDCTEKCGACHKLPGDATAKDLKGLSGDAKMKKTLEYQAGAIHENCRACHKEWNKKNNKKGKEGAPTSCNDCHPKK